jgi:hypothetical protein
MFREAKAEGRVLPGVLLSIKLPFFNLQANLILWINRGFRNSQIPR